MAVSVFIQVTCISIIRNTFYPLFNCFPFQQVLARSRPLGLLHMSCTNRCILYGALHAQCRYPLEVNVFQRYPRSTYPTIHIDISNPVSARNSGIPSCRKSELGGTRQQDCYISPFQGGWTSDGHLPLHEMTVNLQILSSALPISQIFPNVTVLPYTPERRSYRRSSASTTYPECVAFVASGPERRHLSVGIQ